jgi:hypothetical protein
LGDLLVESGVLVIFWAAENGSSIRFLPDAAISRPTGDMAIDTATLAVRVSSPLYSCFHDYIETPAGNGRRLHLVAR